MSRRTVGSSRHAIESCIFKLHGWKPFHLPTTFPKTLEKPDTTSVNNPPPSSKPHKRPCLSDRATSFSIENLDMSKLSLFDDDGSVKSVKSRRGRVQWMARKRRRRGSRSVNSVSGRSSDQSGTRRRCCSVGGSNAYGTCSDFMMANNGGTDSSGELFVNGGGGGDVNWASDAGEVAGRNVRRESGDRENLNGLVGLHHCYGNLDGQGNDSGYGSEPGYRGDAEFGYGDEFDEEEDDSRLLFWGNKFGDAVNMETIGENTLQKAHHRCRRKKNELRMIDAV